MMPIRIGIDSGGTFTDIVVMDDRSGAIVHEAKVLSTPDDPARAILKLVEVVSSYFGNIESKVVAIHHGTTVGTNALIQKQGAKTALVTTKGFKDVLELRRQTRPQMYNLHLRLSPSLVRREGRWEVDERVNSVGDVVRPVLPTDVDRVIDLLKCGNYESVAISLIHSYACTDNERELEAAIESRLPNLFISRSSDLSPEFGEYERASTTVANAYIGPILRRYLTRVERGVKERHSPFLYVVKSNGGLQSFANASRYPVHTLESGPAAGIVAVQHLSRQIGINDLIAYDMGGTTAKAGLIKNGTPVVTTVFDADRYVEGRDVSGYPIKVSVVDMVEIGSGGGSIARVNQFGVMKVGPDSAGAVPGPACYGLGGTEPTVTDAHVVLGHIDAGTFNRGSTSISGIFAAQAVGRLARQLDRTLYQAAWDVVRLAVANMTEMLRQVTVRRGVDPRGFALVGYGGAGPLHAALIASELDIPDVIIPPRPGVFSSIGALAAELRHDFAQTFRRPLNGLEHAALERVVEDLRRRAAQALARDDTTLDGATQVLTLDMSYRGQVFQTPVSLPSAVIPSIEELDRMFRDEYEAKYGYRLSAPVELVTVRFTAAVGLARPRVVGQHGIPGAPTLGRCFNADGSSYAVQVWRWGEFPVGQMLDGPMLIHDGHSTVYVPPGHVVEQWSNGVLHLGRNGKI